MMRFATPFKVCIVFALCYLTACNKETGENQNLDPSKQEANDYMSTKAGSWWMYGTADSVVYKRLATGRDSVKDGYKYSYYISIDTTAADLDTIPEYYGKNENRYVRLFDIDGNEMNYVKAILLKDSARTGDTWLNTETYQSAYDITTESKVTGTGQTHTINGKTYTNVIEVHNDIKGKVSSSPVEFNVGTIDVWFCKGVGLVKQYVDIDIFTFVSLHHKDSLLDYHIEP